MRQYILRHLIQKKHTTSKNLYACILITFFSLFSFKTLAQIQPSTEKVKINIGVADFYIDIGVADFYIDIGVEDFYINIGVADFYNEISISDIFAQMGVATVAQPNVETGLKFDKGYILTNLKDMKPGQRFAGAVKDAARLEKVCGIQGVKIGSPVDIVYHEKAKFRMSFPDLPSKKNPPVRD
jgi:hypothetical protein